MSKLTLSQFKAVLYADIFSFPLTSEEVRKFEIRSTKSETNPNFKFQISNFIRTKSAYCFLKDREELVELRKKRKKYSQKKLKIAEKVGKWLKIIPDIKMTAVTGAVSANNTKKDDDIDLMIVSAKNRVWTTRFFSILLVELLGKRRRPKDKNFKNKICLNMFLDEENLAVPASERDLFSAHEAAQIKVLWSRDGMEEKFWNNNFWIGNYLPKLKDSKIQRLKASSKLKNQKSFKKFWILKLIYHLSFKICNFCEDILKQIQLAYMRSKRTKEIVTHGYLRFHPQDAREWVMREYGKRLREYGL